MTLSICVSVYLFINLSLYQSIHLLTYPSTYLSNLSIYLSIYPIYLTICLSIHPSVHLRIYRYLLFICVPILDAVSGPSYIASNGNIIRQNTGKNCITRFLICSPRQTLLCCVIKSRIMRRTGHVTGT